MNPYIKGENNPKARLTVEKVRNARVEYELYKGVGDPMPGKNNNRVISAAKLARKYRVAASTMWGILSRKTWRFVNVLIVLSPLMFSGCRGLDRLTGGGDDEPAPVTAPQPLRILGAWDGSVFSGQIPVNNGMALVNVSITTQDVGNVAGTYTFSYDNSDQPGGPPPTVFAQGTLTGTIDVAGAFSYATEESSSCHGSGAGTVVGNTMTVTWTGQSGCDFWFTGSGDLAK